jgi:hypothetical protein
MPFFVAASCTLLFMKVLELYPLQTCSLRPLARPPLSRTPELASLPTVGLSTGFPTCKAFQAQPLKSQALPLGQLAQPVQLVLRAQLAQQEQPAQLVLLEHRVLPDRKVPRVFRVSKVFKESKEQPVRQVQPGPLVLLLVPLDK